MQRVKQKSTALILCLGLLVSLFTPLAAAAPARAAESVAIMCSNEQVNEISVTSLKPRELSADFDGSSAEYQWQISAEVSGEEVWVNISGENDRALKVSYPLVVEMLRDNKAKLRCTVKDGDKIFYSGAVTVNASEAVPDFEKLSDGSARKISPAADPEQGGKDFENFRTITVRYVYTDGTEAHAPYAAKIENGASFSATVVSPDIVGFEPKLDNDSPAAQVTLSYENVTDDITVTVTYHPLKVPYRVEHYTQKLINDSYILHQTDEETGYVGAMTDAEEQELEGFRAQPVKNIKIAADGSTVVQIYYDRLYYLMAFKLDGGYGTEPIYARYGSPVSVSKPAKAGYIFKGWKQIAQSENGELQKDETGSFVTVGDVTELPRTLPAKNTAYLAVWEKVEATYTVIYMVQNQDDNGYSYFTSQHKTALTGERVNGIDDIEDAVLGDKNKTDEIRYFKYNDTKTDKSIEVRGDSSTVVKVYYDRKEYTLRFYFAKEDSNGNKYISLNTNNWQYEIIDYTKINPPAQVWNDFIKGAEIEKKANGDKYYYMKLTARYKATITDKWPTVGQWPLTGSCDILNYRFVSWGTEQKSGYWANNSNKNIKGPYLRMDSELIIDPDRELAQELMAFYNVNDVKDYTYEIYFMDLKGAYPEEPTRSYKIRATSKANAQTVLPFPGMVWEKTEYLNGGDGSNQSGGKIKYFYKRKEYNLSYHSHGIEEKKTLLYEQPLSGFDSYTPPYPEDLARNLYEFKGWYTTPEHLPETKYDFETGKMTNSDLSLYALWSPKSFTVRFFPTALCSSDSQIGDTLTVQYGSSVPEPEEPYPPVSDTETELTFGGWFYMSDGVEKAVDFGEFHVQDDTDIYARWISSVDIPFTVRYRLADGTEVAPPLEGWSKGGENRTFQAKTDNLLYEQYRNGYYPQLASHTVVMKSPQGESYDFIYENAKTTKYTVRYLDRETHSPLLDEKQVTDNTFAVVEEKYKEVKEYVPDAFTKRLTVTTAPSQNVITFWYRKAVDPQIAPYTITHYLQDPDNLGTYFLYQYRNVQQNAETDYLVSVLEPEGYDFSAVKVENYDTSIAPAHFEKRDDGVLVTLPPKGAEIKLYYNCRQTSYTVRHLDYHSNEPIVSDKVVPSFVGRTVTEKALTAAELLDKSKSHYSVYGAAAQTRVLAEEAAEGRVNEFIFYYTEKEIDYHYVPVVRTSGYTDFGAVTLSAETVKVSNGTASGSAPIESAGFRFIDWYLDEACTMPVSASAAYSGYLKEDNKLIPQKTDDGVYAYDETADGQLIFYALFEPNVVTDLIIHKTDADDEYQVFVYRITGSYGMDMEVTVVGNGIATIHNLPRGSYTVTEDNGWSWRYINGEEVKNEIPNHGDTFAASETYFSTTAPYLYWLDGHSPLVKNKKEKELP